MGATIPSLPAPRKATRGVGCRADIYQRARQDALRGLGERVAESCGISWWTLQHELADAGRDPVRRVAARVRALFDRGADVAVVAQYLGEVLDAFEAGAQAEPRSFDELLDPESVTDADEDVLQQRYAMGRSAGQRRVFVEYLVRDMAAKRALIAAARREGVGA